MSHESYVSASSILRDFPVFGILFSTMVTRWISGCIAKASLPKAGIKWKNKLSDSALKWDILVPWRVLLVGFHVVLVLFLYLHVYWGPKNSTKTRWLSSFHTQGLPQGRNDYVGCFWYVCLSTFVWMFCLASYIIVNTLTCKNLHY